MDTTGLEGYYTAPSAPSVIVRFKPDTAELDSSVRDLGANIQRAMVGALVGVDAARAGFGLLVDQVKSAFAAARDLELAEIKLGTALKNRGDTTGVVTQQLKAMNEELARSKALNEAELATVERSLALHGVNNAALVAATKATVGLAQVTGGDLQSAAVQVSRVIEGHTKGLERLGIQSKDAGDALQKLIAISREQSGEFGTTAGQLKLLNEEWGRFTRELVTGHGDPKDTWSYKAVSALRGVVRELKDDLPQTVRDLGQLIRGDAIPFLVHNEIAQVKNQPGAVNQALGLGSPAAAELAARQQQREDASIAAAQKQAYDAQRAARAKKAYEEEQWSKEQQAKALEATIRFNERENELAAKLSTERLKTEEELGKKISALKQGQHEYDAKLDDAKFESKLYTMSSQQRRLLELKRAGISQELEAQRVANQQLADLDETAQRASLQAMSGIISGMVASALKGKSDFGHIIESMIGGFIVTMGQMLVQIGTAAVMAGIVGQAVPILGIVTGGPAGVGAGLLAIAAGSVMMGVGQAMGATDSGGGSSSAAGTRATASTAPSSSSRSMTGPGTMPGFDQMQPAAIHVHFDRGVIAANPRPFARAVGDMLKDGTTNIGWAH